MNIVNVNFDEEGKDSFGRGIGKIQAKLEIQFSNTYIYYSI